ncbi:ABC transporter substrate-binding protein [Aquibium sp. ELW1220]|uniref:ABC transporter substrate-binding protein n=1 Tax=Aquibium sp. ELW1220 TaxID=2976766 RepID=UPI0025B213AF|nr:ABC transporter substrate-binding protein [Aquibium sp. ELW1220]MDN2583846.1 ABC transporter substrate-binding protein [Aquibium sp. ELW1220]
MFHFARAAASAAIALGLLAATPGARAAEPIGDGGVIRMMASPYGSQSFIPFVIDKFDLDTKYGFELERIVFSDSKAAAAAVQSGSAEIALFDWNSLALMRNGGIDVIGIAPFITYVSTIVVPETSPINGVGDLKGTKFGIFSRQSTDWILVDTLARKKYELDLARDAQLVEAAPPLLRGSLEQGAIDATIMFSSIAPDMLATGKFRNAFAIRDVAEELGLPLAPYLMIGTTERYAAEKPQNVKAFVAAYQEVYDILMKDDGVWQEQGTNMKLSPEAIVFYRDQMRRDMLRSFMEGDEATLNKTFDLLLETAGAKALGMEKMPETILSLGFQQ